MFEKYTPQTLRGAIEYEMRKTDDPIFAAKLAMKNLEKDPDYYVQFGVMEKAKYIRKIPKAGGGWKYIYKEGKKRERKVEKKKDNIEKREKLWDSKEKFYNYRRDKSELDEEVIFTANNPEDSRHYGDFLRVMVPTENTLDLRKESKEKEELENHYKDWLIDDYGSASEEELESLFDDMEENLNPREIVSSGGAWDNIEFINYLYDKGWFSSVDGVITDDGALFFESNDKNTLLVQEIDSSYQPTENDIKNSFINKTKVEESMQKAKPTKYIKRIPNPSGKGYRYFYTQAEYKKYQQEEKPKEKKEAQKEGWINKIAGIFGFKTRGQVMNKIESDYKSNEMDKKYGLTWNDWKDHLAEYFSNKEKWDSFFSGKKEKKEKEPKKETEKKEKKAEKKVKKSGLKLSVMKKLFELYGGMQVEQKDNFETMPEAEEKPVEVEKKPTKTIDTGNGSKIETNATLNEDQKKEEVKDEEIASREGYFNERPAEILNVGKDVWGAARHRYTTYEKFDADISQMEKDGTAQAYVTKKNLLGSYGLENKDERVYKGETDYKVLASYAIRDYLLKMPENSEESRQKYIEFTRAIARLDDNTKNSSEYLMGLSEAFYLSFPQEEKKPGEYRDVMARGSKVDRSDNIIGKSLRVFFKSLGPDVNQYEYYSLDKKEKKQFNNLANIMLSESGEKNLTYEDLRRDILGATKASGIKIKKGDNIKLTEDLKEKVYSIESSFDTPENKDKYFKTTDEFREFRKISIPYGFNTMDEKDKAKYSKKAAEFYGVEITSREAFDDLYSKKYKELRETLESNITKTKIYPETIGQVVKAGKKSIHVSFEFPDGKIRTFNVSPERLTPESIESVKKSSGKKSTLKINLYVESQVERIGGKEFDIDASDAQKRLSEDFQLKSLQYGNAMTKDERRYHTKWTMDAFSDLSDILDLPMEQISVNGKLGLAFGARGKGGALAHYEPTTKMINLTRANGFGSLAHEWGHFLDNMMSKDMGSYISETPDYVTKRVSSKDEIKHGSIYTHKRRDKETRYYFDKDAPNPAYPFVKLAKGQTEPGEDPKYTGFYRYDLIVQEPVTTGFMDTAQKIASLARSSLQEQGKQTLEALKDDDSFDGKIDRLQVQGLMESKYYNSKVECFARAFESYVADKLEDNGRKNTYLSSKRKTIGEDGIIVYPQKDFRNETNKLFDQFFNELRGSEDLKKAIENFGNRLMKKFNPKTHEFEYRRI